MMGRIKLKTILPLEMELLLNKAHELVLSSEDIKIYSHIDCDGISSGAVLSSMLDSLNKEHEIEFISLDKIDDLELNHELTIFSDLGSGQHVDNLSSSLSNILILDHHPSVRSKNFNKTKVSGNFLEVNPNFFGVDGSTEICGGGLCYLLARTFGYSDLSWLGVLAGVGDMQNTHTGKFFGLNKFILQESVNLGQVKAFNDLSIYGRQTRPLFIALSFFGDFPLPTTNNKKECILLLEELGINIKDGDYYRTLSDLTQDEKQKLFSELLKMLSKEVPRKYVKHIPKLILGESYEFLHEEPYTVLRDASEFSSAINACSRNNNADVAFRILKGNRSDALDEMELLSKNHRQYLAQKIGSFEDDVDKIKHMSNLQYFVDYNIRSEVIGTIASMVLSYADWRKPILAFTPVNNENDTLKVSLRCSRLLSYEGIHFGNIIKEVSRKVGGNGGGHSVACGAYIPPNKQDEFLHILNLTLNDKLNI